VKAVRRWIRAEQFYLRHVRLAGRKKVVYALTPPPRLSNIGDHAQVVAIEAWLARQLSGWPVLEVDKDISTYGLRALRRLVSPEDRIILHSGGNLGDRGRWSENARRGIIEAFGAHPIVSLPQTIHFSDTEAGRAERARSAQIYRRHPRLAVLGRDPRSAELAAELSPRAVSFACPDFVLSLPPRPGAPVRPAAPEVLACLRLDNESTLSEDERVSLSSSLGARVQRFDTTLAEPIAVEARRKMLDETLERFRAVDAVVTDRYHGLIFAVLTRRPTVVLPTVDHKLTSAAHWFASLRYVRFASTPDEVPELLQDVLRADDFETPDWNALYFDPLLDRVEREGEATWGR
jgi:pyruvyl transferase EpsI